MELRFKIIILLTSMVTTVSKVSSVLSDVVNLSKLYISEDLDKKTGNTDQDHYSSSKTQILITIIIYM